VDIGEAKGIELSGRISVLDDCLYLKGHGTFQKARNKTPDVHLFNKVLPLQPETQLGASLEWLPKSWEVLLQYRAMGRRFTTEDNTDYLSTAQRDLKPFTALDVTLGWRRSFKIVKMGVRGQVVDENDSSPMFRMESVSLLVANLTTLSAVNLESGDIANNIFGLGNAPNDMVIAEDWLVVVNSLSNDLNFFRITGNRFLFFDGVTDVGLAQNNNPWAAAPDGNGHLLITNMMQNSVSVLSLESRTVERTLPAGVAPEPVAVVGDYAYVGNTGYDFATYSFQVGTIWKYDLDTWQIVDSLSVGTNPQDIALDPLGRLHVVCTGDYMNISGKVCVVQPEPLCVVRLIETGGTPNRVAFAPDSMAYLSAGGWGMSGDPAGFVMKYRYDTGEVLRGAEHPIRVGQGANDITASRDGRVFVSCFSDNRVDEIRGDTVFATYVVGIGPSAILLAE
jgi:hypothetical protein